MSRLIFLFMTLTLLACNSDSTVGSKLFSNNSNVLPTQPEPEQDPLSPEQRARFTVFQQVLGAKCMQCHNGNSDDASDFSDLKREQDWVGAFYVAPGEPENSLIYTILIGAGVDPNNESMPSVGLALNDDQLESVRDWITNIDPSTFVDDSTPVQRCGTADAVGAPARTARVVEIFRANCTNCHNAAAAIKNLDLTTDQEFYDVGAVTPGNLNGSVYPRLNGQNEILGQARDMGNLSQQEIADIRAWVCQMPAL